MILPQTAGTESIVLNRVLLGRERVPCHHSNGPLFHSLAEGNSKSFEKIASSAVKRTPSLHKLLAQLR